MLLNLPYPQILTPPDLINEAEALYAPHNHPVLQLVLPLFETQATSHYNILGCPTVAFESFWTIYRWLLACFRIEPNEEMLQSIISSYNDVTREIVEDVIPLIENQKELQNGRWVVGDDRPSRPSSVDSASFTDDEQDELEDDPSEVESANFTDEE